MPAYLGDLGWLVPVSCASSLRPVAQRPTTMRQTLGGRVTARRGPRAHRSWDVSMDARRPDELATIAEFVHGLHGVGPFRWVDEWAQVTNVLTPRDGGSWSNAVQGGPVRLPDGQVAARSFVKSGTLNPEMQTAGGGPALVPVVPGRSVTVSAYVSVPGTRVTALFYDAAGGFVGSLTSPESTGVWDRVARSWPVLATAAWVRVVVASPTGGAFTRPAVTWTDQVMPYHHGQAAEKVLIDGWSQDVVLAHAGRGGQLAGGSFRVTEVG